MQQETKLHIPITVMGAILLLAFCSGIRHLCIPPMEHIISEELNITHAQTSLLITIPMLMAVALSIPAGIISDRLGLKKAAGIGAICFATGCVLRGTTTDFPLLLVFSAIVGLGGAFIPPNMSKFISLWFPSDRVVIATGMLMSVMTTGGAIVLAITLPVIFPITNTFQGTFLILSIPTVIAAGVWWALAKEPPAGSIVNEPSATTKMPVRQILGNKNLLLVAFLFFICSFFFFNWLAWAPQLMMERGASPELAGIISSVVMWTTIPTLLLVPRLSHKLGLRKPLLWLPCLVLALAPWLAMNITVTMGLPLMIMVGMLDSTRTMAIRTLPIEIMPREAVGTATGLVMSLGSTGGVIGPLVGGYLLDITGSMNLSLTVLIGVSLAAAVIAFRIPETGPKARLNR